MKITANKKTAWGMIGLTIIFVILSVWFGIIGYDWITVMMIILGILSGGFALSLLYLCYKSVLSQNDYIIYRKIYRYASNFMIMSRYQMGIKNRSQLKNKRAHIKNAEWNALLDEAKIRSLL